jgi:hypothetical protein
MSGYLPEPEKPKGSDVKAFSFYVLGPALLGGFLLFDGLYWGRHIEASAAAFCAAPFVARWAWRGGMWD